MLHLSSNRFILSTLVALLGSAAICQSCLGQIAVNRKDARNQQTAKPAPVEDPALQQYGIYEATAPRPDTIVPIATRLPLDLQPGTRIAFIGNMLLEREQYFGHLETLLHQRYPNHKLVVRNLAWPADTPSLQPRPDNFADVQQHLKHENIDVILAAFGFNESFDGPPGIAVFKTELAAFINDLKTKSFNGRSAPQIVLISPIASENIDGVPAADRNNQNLVLYTGAMQQVAQQAEVGFVNAMSQTMELMESPATDLTINGVHLNETGYDAFAKLVFRGVTGETGNEVDQTIRQTVIDKNRQYQRRYRPLNTFYYTGGRSKTYGYLDFLPAMRNFDILTANREQRIWDQAEQKEVAPEIDDSNLPPLPETKQSRGANRWMTAKAEMAEFKVDPRFEVTLFAGEEEFPDIAAPIQIRWDNQGRLWVACSTTYPHVYPGNEPNDKLVILEDTDGDGKADSSHVWADDLHIPLSFEFGDGGVYISDEPHLTFLKDSDGNDKADFRQKLFSGFGTEDSHHSLHDFVWSPGGDLIFRESIFHHSQVETAYGPVRQQNSGWFRLHPDSQRLTSFGTYHSTNPWGATFDDWGQHVASHPIYAAAFHSLDPPYPTQHPVPSGLNAYSGTCGQEFVDFGTFPDELQGGYLKARYKPTNRIEIHKWVEGEFGYDEEYQGDVLFSSNLSFIPVDIRFGPRGAMYVCDWYNPVKGHAQYSLRDERRDRHSGRIWRITTKGKPLQDPPKIATATIGELLESLKRPESRIRYWIRRELRERDPQQVHAALDRWVASIDKADPRQLHHKMEAIWMYRGIGKTNQPLLRELLTCDDHHARAAATEQLRYWHGEFEDAIDLARKSANDENAIVRMQAAILTSYIGTKEAFDVLMDVLKHPAEGHLSYAITCALGSHTMRRHWENDDTHHVAKLLRAAKQKTALKEPSPSAPDAQFDQQDDLAKFTISCLPEVMKYDREQIAVKTGQSVKIVFTNPDATDHNMVFVRPGALEEVGMAANEMARDPKNANSDFIPRSKRKLIMHASKMIGPTRKSKVHVFRFKAPKEPGIYPYVCTFPGHWIVMKGIMVVADDLSEVDAMVAKSQPRVIKQWTLTDFAGFKADAPNNDNVMRGMTAFAKARCDQCHALDGHGVDLGPKLTEVTKKHRDEKLIQQLLEPSAEINEKFVTHKFLLADGSVVTGVIAKESKRHVDVMANLLTPKKLTRVDKAAIEEQVQSKISAMPTGLLDVLTREEISDLVTYLQSDGFQLPDHLKNKMKMNHSR
ncbi:PVC-type heme-binding CxxCH protein [Planctomycetes bacterium K23_9]|uniref:Auracyanin-A n=1 Tax=Stieleria marina TaxID=1930275 RepID=A0A517NX63_9BACT|nr:Auracyanin-A precursor [Planctomycetes bacterium K23_9]